MCTFDKYIWEKYTLQKYSWKKYTFKYNICTSSETGALNMHQFCLCFGTFSLQVFCLLST